MSVQGHLQKLHLENVPEVIDLIQLAMNREEADWAKSSMQTHFKLASHEVDDGRDYFVYRETDEIRGIIGLHHYDWGPPENVWLSWFAVHPAYQRQGIGNGMFSQVLQLAKKRNYRKLFVETYSGPVFDKARKFYTATGMEAAGHICNYLPDQSDMIIFKMNVE